MQVSLADSVVRAKQPRFAVGEHEVDHGPVSVSPLIYNGWSWYVRLAHPKARLETITGRPLLLSAVSHAGHSRLLLTLSHAAGDQTEATIATIRTGLAHVLATAPQLPKPEQWRALVRSIIRKDPSGPQHPPPSCLPPPCLAPEVD